MRFWTIWTMPAISVSERLRRTRDWAAMKTASYLPKRVKYWSFMLEAGKATRTSENIPATPLSEILNNLDAPKNLS